MYHNVVGMTGQPVNEDVLWDTTLLTEPHTTLSTLYNSNSTKELEFDPRAQNPTRPVH